MKEHTSIKTSKKVLKNKAAVSETGKSSDADFEKIHHLVKLITENNIGELSFEKKDYKLTIKQLGHSAPPSYYMPASGSFPLPTIPTPPPASSPISAPPTATLTEGQTDSRLLTIKSSIIGTFYRRPAPDKASFVEVGDNIKKGQVICIVEAMKLFNEIESEVEGKVVKILVEDKMPVEFDQPLFLIEPQ